MRLMHEANTHTDNWFATLTYDDDKLPPNKSLRPEDFVLFMKRFRHKHPGIRFYQVGEYGDNTERPHHHAIFYNCRLTDLKVIKHARGTAHALYTSQDLESNWKQGIVSIGAVTFQSASYCASYVTKRITGPGAEAHYRGRIPEYATMSRRPGIGREYWERYKQEILDNDEIIVNNLPCRPPKYYDRIREQEDPEQFALDKLNRLQHAHYLNRRQREAKEVNQLAKINLYRRRTL